MAQQSISLGAVADDGTGSNLREGGDIINDNFNELYAAIPQFWRTGKWRPLSPGTGLASVAGGTAMTSGFIRLLPIPIWRPVTLTDLGIRVSTLFSGGTCNLGIYDSHATTGDPTGTPLGTVLGLSTTTADAVSAALTAGNLALDTGLYWGAVQVDNNTAAFTTLLAASIPTASIVGHATLGTATSGAGVGAHSLSATSPFASGLIDLTGATFNVHASSGDGLIWGKPL